MKFSNGVTVAAVFHSEGRSTKAVIVFVVPDSVVKASSVRTGWGLAVVSNEPF